LKPTGTECAPRIVHHTDARQGNMVHAPRNRPTERPARPLRVLVLNRSYWPDVEATGQLLTELCEELARDCLVTVIAGQPNHSFETGALPARETRNGVEIVRVRNRRYSKASLWSRGAGLSSYLLLSTWQALRQPRPDVVIAESDPPMLGLLGAFLRRWHRCKLVNYLQDLHPEVGLALGKLRPGPLAALLKLTTQIGLRAADRVVVLGQDMRRRVVARGVREDRVAVIPNWSDTTAIRPGPPSRELRAAWGTGDSFVVMYSGNLGLSQNLDQVIDAAELMAGEPVTFVLAGEGASKERLQKRAAEKGLTNVRFLPYAPKERLGESLGAADLHLVTLQAGLAGYIVPSKLYGILAAGRPYVAAVDADSEVAALTDAHGCGVRVAPDSPAELAAAIRRCAADPDGLVQMGQRARVLAEQEFDRVRAADRFRETLAEVTRKPRCILNQPVAANTLSPRAALVATSQPSDPIASPLK
jgi:colanic acid biosynthesis glycosyl transferase WcaI